MSSFWDIPGEFEGTHDLNVPECWCILKRHKSVRSLQRYFERLLKEISENPDLSSEVKHVAVPLAYRLSIDDTARGYRIAAKLKEAAMFAAHPQLMACVGEEVEWICQTACGVSYKKLPTIRFQLEKELIRISYGFDGEWKCYGRRKSVSSTFTKLAHLKKGLKRPKSHDDDVIRRLESFLVQFQSQVMDRVRNAAAKRRPYHFEDVKHFIPDLLAFTLQLREPPESTRNLGATKARYRAVASIIERKFSGRMFFGPAYSKAWHMNRMVCHLEYPVDLAGRVPMELFVRTDFDYFIGYGNYWRYKGVDLFAASSKENRAARDQFVRRVRSCRSFTQVQRMLLSDVITGQLSLF